MSEDVCICGNDDEGNELMAALDCPVHEEAAWRAVRRLARVITGYKEWLGENEFADTVVPALTEAQVELEVEHFAHQLSIWNGRPSPTLGSAVGDEPQGNLD